MLSRRLVEHAFERGVVLDLFQQGQTSDRPIEAMLHKAAGSDAQQELRPLFRSFPFRACAPFPLFRPREAW